MPSDPDNKMDELLKSYAKKRRDEAGDPPEMHPATRRLLQAEIAKLRPEPSAPKVPWWQNLVMIWPRLAFAAGVFVALGIATWSLIDSAKQSASESQLAKNDPTVAEKASAFAESRDSLRDEKSRMVEPVRPAPEAAPQSRLVEDRVEAAGAGGREADALSKQKVAEVTKAEGAVPGERYYRSVAPSAPAPSAPPAANKPVTLAEQESLLAASGRASALQPAPTRPALSGDVRAKDTANLAFATEAPGKNSTANEEVKLGLAPVSTPINGQDVNLSIAVNKQAGNLAVVNAVVANADGVDARKRNNDTRLPGGVLPPTDAPAQQPLGNTVGSLDAFYAANQNKSAAGAQVPKLQLDLNDNSGQAPANNREVLLRQNNYDQGAAVALGRTVAPAAQTPPAESKSDQVALAGAKVASDKMVREQSEAVPTRTDSNAYGGRGVAPGQSAQNANLYRQRFAQVPPGGQGTVFKKISAPDTKVLSNFEVQRNGGQVRVVDADGSVYDGQVVADTTVAAIATDEVRRSETRQQQTPASPQAAASDADAQNWAFRVSGTNRTLRQPVSLEGVMQNGLLQNQAGQSQVAPLTAQSRGAGAPAGQLPGQPTRQAGPTAAYKEQVASQFSSSVTNSYGTQRMQGRLRVGSTSQVQLEAVPADR